MYLILILIALGVLAYVTQLPTFIDATFKKIIWWTCIVVAVLVILRETPFWSMLWGIRI